MCRVFGNFFDLQKANAELTVFPLDKRYNMI